MAILNSHDPAYLGDARNCRKCGNDFLSDTGKGQLCPTCRKPRARNYMRHPSRASVGKPLTPRQKQITKLVADGLENREIADQLHLAEGTVKCFLSEIFDRVGVSNRVQLAVWSISQNL